MNKAPGDTTSQTVEPSGTDPALAPATKAQGKALAGKDLVVNETDTLARSVGLKQKVSGRELMVKSYVLGGSANANADPPALPQHSVAAAVAAPGAVAVRGGQLEHDDVDAEAQRESTRGDDHLMVANTVDAYDHDSNIPQASELDSTRARAKTAAFWRGLAGGYCALILIIAVVVAAVLVAVLYIVPKENNESSPDTDMGTGMTPLSTQAPTSFQPYLYSLLPDDTIEAFDNTDSAQSMALEWLLVDQTYNEYPTPYHILQRFALATLYFSTSGHLWQSSDYWLDHQAHECTWFIKDSFARATDFTPILPAYVDMVLQLEIPSQCDYSGRYLNLWLDINGLKGTLPEELYMITSLKTLSFGVNKDIGGTLSTRLGQLTNLIGFFGAAVSFEGTIPTQIGSLTNIEVFSIYRNSFVGEIPHQLWELPLMRVLAMGPDQSLDPSLQTEPYTIPTNIHLLMPDLQWFHHDYGSATGTIPTTIGQLTNLGFLSFPGNSLSGTIPTELGNCAKLNAINLSEQYLSGRIPSELGRLEQLGWVELFDNSLTGALPAELGDLHQTLHDVYLENNALTGEVPEALCNLTGPCWFYSLVCVPDPERDGLVFDCNDNLCGCGCNCSQARRLLSGHGGFDS